MNAKQKGLAVDKALKALLPADRSIVFNVQFFKDWAKNTRKLGGYLSEVRVQKAFQKLSVKVTSVTSKLREILRSYRWNSLLATFSF